MVSLGTIRNRFQFGIKSFEISISNKSIKMDYKLFLQSENALSRGCKQLKNVIIEGLKDDKEKELRELCAPFKFTADKLDFDE